MGDGGRAGFVTQIDDSFVRTAWDNHLEDALRRPRWQSLVGDGWARAVSRSQTDCYHLFQGTGVDQPQRLSRLRRPRRRDLGGRVGWRLESNQGVKNNEPHAAQWVARRGGVSNL